MSQTIRFTKINEAVFPEVFTGFPDRDQVIGMIQSMIEDGVLSKSENYYEAETEWYEIGSGESDTDTFFTDEALIKLWNKGGISEIEKEAKAEGYDIDYIQSDTMCVLSDEME